MTKLNSAARNALKSEASRLLALVAPAAFAEAVNALAAAKAIKAAIGKARLTGADGKDSARVLEVRNEYIVGYVAPRLTSTGNMSEADRIIEARKVCADPKRGELVNTIMASGRQSWKRARDRAGIPSGAANAGKNNGKAKGDTTKAGQGATDKEPSKTIEIDRERAKALPPVKPDRENVVEYIRVGLAAMLVTIEKANQSAAKTKGKAVPLEIQSFISDAITTAKTWVI